MKKILLYFKIALLLVTTSSTAQTYYSHYLDGTSEWRYYNGGVFSQNYYSYVYQTLFFDGFEDYGGFTYHRERFFTEIKYFDSWTNELLQVDEYYPTLYNLVREDAQGRFYRRGYTDYTVEEMYQDNLPILNSQVGDIFPSLPDFNFGACPILTIQQLGIAGLNIKKLMGTNGPYGGLVEGVGPLGQACNGGANSLVCYTKQGESLIFEPGTDCSIFPLPVRLSNPTFHENSIKIYPNPTNGIVTIESNEVIEKIELWDMLGRKLITQNSSKVDLSLFSKGTYILITKTDKQQQTQRIIKN
jgi:hypothetical protein